MVTDGGWYTANDGTAVDGGRQKAWFGNGKSQKSGQHHQLEHFDLRRSALFCGQTGLKMSWDMRAFIQGKVNVLHPTW